MSTAGRHIDNLGNHRPPCHCKTCRISRAMLVLAEGIEEWMNDSCEMEMSLAYLREEVTAIAALPWWRGKRARLRNALRVVSS